MKILISFLVALFFLQITNHSHAMELPHNSDNEVVTNKKSSVELTKEAQNILREIDLPDSSNLKLHKKFKNTCSKYVSNKNDKESKQLLTNIKNYLDQGANPNLAFDVLKSESPTNKHYDFIKLLLKYNADHNFSCPEIDLPPPLFYLCNHNQDKLIKLLLLDHANTNIKFVDKFGNQLTALSSALGRLQDDEFKPNSTIIELLLIYGANPNIVFNNNDDETPLFEWKNTLETVLLLIEFGADINAQNTKKMTVLMNFVDCFTSWKDANQQDNHEKKIKENMEIIKLLLYLEVNTTFHDFGRVNVIDEFDDFDKVKKLTLELYKRKTGH